MVELYFHVHFLHSIFFLWSLQYSLERFYRRNRHHWEREWVNGHLFRQLVKKVYSDASIVIGVEAKEKTVCFQATKDDKIAGQSFIILDAFVHLCVRMSVRLFVRSSVCSSVRMFVRYHFKKLPKFAEKSAVRWEIIVVMYWSTLDVSICPPGLVPFYVTFPFPFPF